MRLSVIVPARNEEALIAGTVGALVRAAGRVPAPHRVEILVVDNASTDATVGVAESAAAGGPVRVLRFDRLGAARARNAGALRSDGDVLVFVDADTQVPPDGLARVVELHEEKGFEAGIFRLAGLDGGLRAWAWWTFWEHVRRLPLSRAKAMPAFMFCTRRVFDELGPFDESVSIAEEWPILASLHRARPRRFVYDRATTALSSSRRMELQPFGYTANLAKYVWAVLHRSGRVHYTDRYRGTPEGAR